MSNKKGNLSFGLNPRNKRKKGLSGFGGDDSDDSNSDNDKGTAPTARGAINRDIALEQEALRKRAKAAMAASEVDSTVYDYDAEYESFSSGKKKEDAAKAAKAAAEARKNEPKGKVQPRYITNLLQTAQRRNQEREIIYERKVVKEQAEEDADNQYEGKEKFITSSYKRKLAEREQWAKEEEERTKREEQEDVTKMKKGAGNFMFDEKKKAAHGNGDESNTNTTQDNMKQSIDDKYSHDPHHDDYQHRESSRETERWGSSKRNRDARDEFSRHAPPSLSTSQHGDFNENGKASNNDVQSEVKTRRQILEERAIKIREARERYFQRRGVTQ
eukprot:CAMPEP_0183748616 /NCGR_PEP_ID=MMETSP0737-20130205/67863_1 /TAXON_ID=385413 /ORGANISM="Thalassiosira miniscula, Strain CCMP1093" /LENGTH=329 /DNA_ID=CAMNT_0025984353 /DNA_START=59 /DNA_END=1049 /DNA_ORIENTATION=+